MGSAQVTLGDLQAGGDHHTYFVPIHNFIFWMSECFIAGIIKLFDREKKPKGTLNVTRCEVVQ